MEMPGTIEEILHELTQAKGSEYLFQIAIAEIKKDFFLFEESKSS